MARTPIGTLDWGDDLNTDLDGIESLAQAAADAAADSMQTATLAAQAASDVDLRVSQLPTSAMSVQYQGRSNQGAAVENGTGLVLLKKITIPEDSIILRVEGLVKGNANNVQQFSGGVWTSDVGGYPGELRGHLVNNSAALNLNLRWLGFPMNVFAEAGDWWVGLQVGGSGPQISLDTTGGQDRTMAPSGAWHHDLGGAAASTTTVKSYCIRALVLALS